MTSVIPFRSKGRKISGSWKKTEGLVVDHGSIGNLEYEVYKRGVIHIFDKNGLRFKKDINAFEEEINELDFESLTDGNSTSIKGSGDNDNLIFTRLNGDIEITLQRRQFRAIEKLREIINKGRKEAA